MFKAVSRVVPLPQVVSLDTTSCSYPELTAFTYSSTRGSPSGICSILGTLRIALEMPWPTGKSSNFAHICCYFMFLITMSIHLLFSSFISSITGNTKYSSTLRETMSSLFITTEIVFCSVALSQLLSSSYSRHSFVK